MPIALTSVKPPEGGDMAVDHMLGFGLIFLLDFTGSYVTGGEVITAPNALKSKFKILGNGNLYFVSIPSRLGYTFDYDYVNDKVIVRQDAAAGAPSAELAAAAYPGGLTGLTGANRVRGFALGR
jgi:hypothetical protein